MMAMCVNVVALLIAVVSFAFALTGLVTEYWSVKDTLKTHTGLWKMCDKFVCFDGDHVGGIGKESLTSVKALIIIGLSTSGVGLGFIIYDIVLKSNKYVSMVMTLLAAITTLAGVITYACRYNEYNDGAKLWTLSWSFALTTTAGAGYAISGILLSFEKRRQSRAGEHHTDYRTM